MFNILSFIGFVHEGVVVYVMYKLLKENDGLSKDKQFGMALIDSLIVTIIGGVVAIVAFNKDQKFFENKDQEEKDGKIFEKYQTSSSINKKKQQSSLVKKAATTKIKNTPD